MSFPRKRESSENNKKYWIPSQAGNDIRGIILYENYNNMELYLGGGHNKSYNLNIIKHYKEMSLIFLTLPLSFIGGGSWLNYRTYIQVKFLRKSF